VCPARRPYRRSRKVRQAGRQRRGVSSIVPAEGTGRSRQRQVRPTPARMARSQKERRDERKEPNRRMATQEGKGAQQGRKAG